MRSPAALASLWKQSSGPKRWDTGPIAEPPLEFIILPRGLKHHFVVCPICMLRLTIGSCRRRKIICILFCRARITALSRRNRIPSLWHIWYYHEIADKFREEYRKISDIPTPQYISIVAWRKKCLVPQVNSSKKKTHHLLTSIRFL